MFFSVLSFVTGILVVQQFSVLPESIWVLCLFLLMIGSGFLRYWRLMFFVMGLLWAICFASIRLADRLPEHLEGQHIQVKGRVVGLPHYNERRVRFDFAISKSTIETNLPGKIRLSWFFPNQQIKSGQSWQFTVKLKRPHSRFNPGGFDYERWLFMQNIGATGYVKNKPPPKLFTNESSWEKFDRLRQKIADKLDVFTGHTGNSGVMKALTIGERHDISNKQWEIFRKTGTVHLMAISGLHIGLVAGLAYLLALKTSIRLTITSPQVIAAIFAIIVAFFYSALAGFSLPTQRALLMLIIAMTAISWQRNIKPANTLALTMFTVLIFDPLAVLSAGFWLSFLAVALIIFSFAGRLGKVGYWQTAIKINWVTAIGLAPLLVFYFQQVSIISPIANLLAVPVISLLVVPLCLIAVFLMFFIPTIAEYTFILVDKILQALWVFLAEISQLPYADVDTASVPFYAIPLALLGVFILISPRGIPGRWLGLLMLLPLLFINVPKPKQGEVIMTLLDVGQGLSAIIETSKHVLVFDTGAKYSDHYDMGDAVVIPFLNSKGIEIVDTLLISHGDNDHIGGAESVINQSRVEKILTSVPLMLPKHFSVRCRAGQSWGWDQIRFEILWPMQNLLSENNNSCVLKVSSKTGSFLLTGDIEAEAENRLVKKYEQQLESDVLISPHHGSKTSSTLAFLKWVSPVIVLIPSGYRNRFSFPHPEVLNRYREINTRWMNTANDGALVVDMKNNLLDVVSIRRKGTKYWN
jgi:competence protein ComEC